MKRNYFKYTMVCVAAIIISSLLLCFDAAAFLLPFTITLMSVSTMGTIVCFVAWQMNE